MAKEMKIGIICFWDRQATPYLAKYEKALQKRRIDYEIVFWNRSHKKALDNPNGGEKYINIPCGETPVSKVISFIRWRLAVARLIRREKYDALIILTTYPAIMLYGMLKRVYQGKYIFDIRDYTQEAYGIYRRRVMDIIESSSFSTISSKGFLTWLDASSKIIINHNITVERLCEPEDPPLLEKKPVRFSFVGNVRLDSQTKALMIAMSNNEEYLLRFYGRILPGCDIIGFCKDNNMDNVEIMGPFHVDDKAKIYKEVDLINAVYANDADDLRPGDATPIPNRLYDAIVFHRPIVASNGTYLAQLIEEYHLGFNINGFDPDVLKKFDDYIRTFSRDTFLKGCNDLYAVVIAEENKFLEKLDTTLSVWEAHI